jgi:hypothetical protein
MSSNLSNQNMPELCFKFYCKICDYGSSKKSSFDNHLLSVKHNKPIIDKSAFKCMLCSKTYKDNSGLWRHKKTHNPKNEILNDKIKEETELGKLTELFLNVVKQNQELQKTLLEMSSKMTVLPINNTTNNTINNTTNNFNLNVFLNETCKDALNLADFVSSLQVNLKDLEETAKFGYTQGVSRIFINGLNELEVNMRPIHCSDAKRETLYIKNNDEWTKEDAEKTNITKAIKKVSNKNTQLIFEWQKKYPEYKDPESKQNDKYQEMIFTAMGGSTDDEQSNNLEKIIRNITKEVIIDKNI